MKTIQSTQAMRRSSVLLRWSLALAATGLVLGHAPIYQAQAQTPPVITNFTPTQGPPGTLVTIDGDHFAGVSEVRFGAVAAQFSVFGAQQLVATVPAGASTGKITVTTPNGAGASAGSFTVTANQGPRIISFSPASGPVGMEVSIAGEHLGGATQVQFNGVNAAFHEGFGGTNVLATVPVGATSGTITVVTPFGSSTSSTSFTVTAAPAPEITGFSPDTGPVGAQVVISGNNFSRVTAVRFNGVQAAFTPFGNTLTTFVPQGATSGPLTVVTEGGSSTTSAIFTVTVAGAPSITSLNPDRGQVGTRVTISGANLDVITTIAFNGIPTIFDRFGSSLFALVPTGATTGPVTVTGPQGSAASPTPFIVLDPLAPEIFSLLPEAGGPGTVVAITGTNLTGVTQVRFGDGVSQAVVAVSATEVRATVPPGATTGPVSLTTPKGTGLSSQTYYVPARIDGIIPASGLAGAEVTIRGANFTSVLAVQFNGVDATFTTISPNEIRTTVPQGARSGAISIATPAGFTSSDIPFLLPPKITRVDPVSGPSGSDVTITGENLLGAVAVRFNGIDAAFNTISATTISATVPDQATHGPISVISAAGTAVSPESFFVGVFSDMIIGLTATPDLVDVGDFLFYTITATNRGPLEARNVVITDRLPSGVRTLFAPVGANCTEANNVITCHVDALAAGADVAIRITATVVDGSSLTNQASVTSDSADPTPANNTVSVVTQFKGAPPPPPDVALTATLTGSSLQLSWPASATGMQLESSAKIGADAAWSVLSVTPTVANGANVVTVNAGLGSAFYRLRKP